MNKTFSCIVLAAATVISFGAHAAQGDMVKITKDKSYASVLNDGDLIKISRIQDTSHIIQGSFAKTSRPCPPFCINPLVVDENVKSVAELEVIDFMEKSMFRGTGAVIDARTPSWYKKGTIPGSINIPFTTFEKDPSDFELIEALINLGAVEREDVNSFVRLIEEVTGLMGGDQKTDLWDFTEAKELVIWCNGPWCGQSPRAIHALLKLGYPAEKLYYYRGGMQMWQILGLTTVAPSDGSDDKNLLK